MRGQIAPESQICYDFFQQGHPRELDKEDE
jgi:hypothetical protein